jgi:HK97 family phage major capsid protein
VNTSLKQKNSDLEGLRIRARKILETHKDELPPEEEKALDALMVEMKALQGQIDTETKRDDFTRDLALIDAYQTQAQHKIAHGINGDDESRKGLLRAGWEVKGGFVWAPTSIEGTTQKLASGGTYHAGKQLMYPEEVLFGPIPEDDKTAQYYRKTRAIFSPEYKAAYVRHFALSVKTGSERMAFQLLEPFEQKALSEGTDTAGGFAVPPDFQAEILAHLPQHAVVRANARVQPTNRDVLEYPAVKANAGTYGGISGASIYSSAFVGSWSGETPAFTDTDPVFQKLLINVRKVRVATKVSNDFAADSATNILAWLATNGAENMALTEDYGFILGDGGPLQPLGLVNAGITNKDLEGSTADTVSNTTASAGSAPKLITLAYSLPAQYVAGAKWLMSRAVEGKIRQLVDGSGRYLWPPFVGSAFAGPMADLLGSPVLQSDWVPADGQDTQPVLFYGDLSAYIIAQRTQITSLVLRERFADTDQTGILLFERIGGGIFNTDAIRGGIC